jgi:putative transposase
MPKPHCAAPELASLLDGSSAGELFPELARHGLQQLIQLELATFLGADRHERTEERLGYRNGYRPRALTAQVGDLELLIPKLRAGSFLPSILEPRRRVDLALHAVIMQACIGGVSTRKVDALVSALGSQSGISKSQTRRICQEIDEQVQASLSRPLQETGYAYVYLDATCLNGRQGKAQQVTSRAAVVAMGVNADGRRELLGLKVGNSETETFRAEFITSLKERALAGVKLVISDAHSGLTKAIRRQLQGCVWQRRTERCAWRHSSGPLLPATCCSASPKRTRAWSRLPCGACSPKKHLLRSRRTGMISPPRWRSASPKPIHFRRSRPEAIA